MPTPDLLKKYPYYAYAALRALKVADSKEERERLKGIIAANVGSEIDLREILGLNSESMEDFYPSQNPGKLSTETTIETFLDKFGAQDDNLYPASQVQSADYVASLIEESASPEAQMDKATASIPKDDSHSPDTGASGHQEEFPVQKKRESIHKESSSTEGLTESFARIMIKNHNYVKALKIIEELNLKNPEKSIYFADQIRFLKKLIITQSKSAGSSDNR